VAMGRGSGAGGHCQVPCGIFDDPKLVADVREACATVRKAMSKIDVRDTRGGIGASDGAAGVGASGGGSHDDAALRFNQNERWVVTKDTHCELVSGLWRVDGG
jgi:small subunit ribosomal protein S27Ae